MLVPEIGKLDGSGPGLLQITELDCSQCSTPARDQRQNLSE
jgi:hypothetical protein